MIDQSEIIGMPMSYPDSPYYTSAGLMGGQGSRAVVFLGSAVLAASLLAGTTSSVISESAKTPAAELKIWTSSGEIGIRARINPHTVATLQPRSLRESVLLLHDLSGLTWDQLGKLLGVSRRAMHLWTAGGRMNSHHAERLGRVIAVVQSINAVTTSERREALLSAGPGGHTIYENLLSEMSQTLGVNGPALTPAELVGALHDQTG